MLSLRDFDSKGTVGRIELLHLHLEGNENLDKGSPLCFIAKKKTKKIAILNQVDDTFNTHCLSITMIRMLNIFSKYLDKIAKF